MTSLLNSNNQSWSNSNNTNEGQANHSVRKRTRATADQLSVLEDTFAVNVSPNSKLRKQLAEQLEMSERSIQIWFQNRRAKVKHMQKRAQMQMHQASIRAQLYGQYGNYYQGGSQSRAQSVDAVQQFQPFAPPLPQFNPSFLYPSASPLRQSMPPFDLNDVGLEFPEYIHGPSPSPSPIPGLKHADPKDIILPTEELWISSPGKKSKRCKQETLHMLDSTHHNTVNPSSLSKEHSDAQDEPKDLYLSATALTVGTWHRLKMNETDLVCVYRPDTRIFAWHIIDGGCHFKMEVSQDSVSSIEYEEIVSQVHFNMSEPPLFYMESVKDNQTVWVQCSDFTEGKQASKFFRHTLKGIQHHLKQEILALIQNHKETSRLVHFVEPAFNNDLVYWPNNNTSTNDDAFYIN